MPRPKTIGKQHEYRDLPSLTQLAIHIGAKHPEVKIGEVARLEETYLPSNRTRFRWEMENLHRRAHDLEPYKISVG